jgi:DNA (cytosine-5)-methyltransferase 1
LGGISPEVPRNRVDLPVGREHEVFGRKVPGRYTAEELHITRRYEDISKKRFRSIPEGGNRFDLPDLLKAPCWIKHTTGSGDVMGRLVWDRPSVTIRTEFFKPEKGRYLHPEEHRALTHHEAARLQGFPDTFDWCGPKLEIARQIGNAVPVPLAQALARHLANGLTSD